MKPSNPTPMIPPTAVERKWYVVDATDQTLGRLASRIAAVVRGKNKPEFAPHWDNGDFVVVINAEKVRLTGRKWQQKRYWRHTGYPGGIRSRTAEEMRDHKPEFLLQAAIRGMLPKNRLGRKLLKKVRIYAGPDHPHVAQNPEPLSFDA
ncbi:MAG: 50S ribosomal protein L13 [Candidatus Dadabacteria bacterium]|nr:MAG: 50S ribosomal protein L13 [Candidatus Dadabacteria bacterium]